MKSARQILLSLVHATQSLTQRVIGRRGIRVREPLAYVLAFALVVVTVGVFLRFHIASTYQGEMAYWRARQAAVADDRALRISDWLTERQADAELISSFPLVRAALRVHHDAGQPSGRPVVRLPELTAVLDEMEGLCSYSGVYVLDREARVVAQSSHSTPLSPLLAATCRDAARTSGRRIDLLGDAPDRSLISFSVPVFAESDPTTTGRPPAQPLGIALVVMDAARTIFPLVAREGVLTQTGETLLVRREGDEVIFFSPLRHFPAGSPNLRFPLSTAPLPARRAVEGLETFVEYNDYWGAPVLATTRYIPLTEWGMVQKINRAEALRNFYRMAIVEGLAAGLLIILLGGLLLFHRRDVLTRVLKQEEAKFRALLESAPDAMVIADGEGRVVLLNAQAETMFGFRRKELIGLGLRMLFPEWAHVQHGESLPWDFSTEVAQQVGKTMEIRGLRKDGTKFPLEARLGYIETAEGPTFSCAIRDITEHKRAEEALKESEERFRSLVENATVGIYRTTPEGHILMANPTLVRMLGYKELVELAVRNLEGQGFEPSYPRQVFRQRMERDGEVGGLEAAWTTRDGSTIFVRESGRVVRGESGEVLYYDGVVEDITERKRAEQAQRESEARYRRLFEQNLAGVFRGTLDGHVLDCNNAYARMLGYNSPQEILDLEKLDYFYDAQEGMAALARLRREGSQANFEIRLKRRDGSPISVLSNVTLTEMGESRLLLVEGTLIDITMRKRAEEARAFLASLVESSQDAIIGTTLEALTVSWNHGAEELYGYSAEEMIGNYVSVLYPPDHLDEFAPLVEKVRQGKRINCYESVRVRKDGTRLDVSLTFSPVYDTTGRITGTVTIARDITERKRAEAEMTERHRLATLVAEVGVALTGAESLRQGLQQCAEILVRNINAALARIWTVNEADKVLELEASAGMYTHLDGGHARVPMGHKLGRIAENGEPHLTNTVQQDSWVGDPEWARREGMVAFAGYPLRVGEHVLGVVAAFARQPLTPTTLQAFASVAHNLAQFIKRKRAEEALRESEEKYRALIETTGTGYVITDMQGRVVDANPEYVRLTGHQALQEILGRRFTEWTAQHDLARTAEAVRRCAELGFTRNFEIEHVNGDGKCTPIEVNATVVPAAGGVRMVGLCRDITERKRAEKALRESEERFRAIVENAPFGYYRVGKDGLWQYVNPVWERMHGLSSEEVIGKRFEITQPPDSVGEARELVKRALAGETIVGEFGRLTREGNTEYHSFNIQPVKHRAEIVGIEGFINDITERKRAEEALRESEERFRLLAETMPDAVLVGQDGRNVYANAAVAHLLRAAGPEELVGFDVFALIAPTHHEWAQQQMQRALAGEKQPPFEDRFVRLDGSSVPVEIAASLLTWQGWPALQVVVRDVTERKRAEESLRESEERFRSLVENATIGIYRTTPQGRILMANPAVVAMLKCESLEELLARNLEEHGFEPGYPRQAFRERIERDGEVRGLEAAWTRQDGSAVFVRESAHVVRGESGNVLYYDGIVEDITERRQAEETLQRSRDQLRALTARVQRVREEERTRVAREIHDELGQDLTAIKIDLSSLSQEFSADKKQQCESILKLVDETIQSLRRISTELRPAILDAAGLVAAIEWAVEEFGARTGTKCRLDLPPDDVVIDQERATALFRILQETLTNVARHANATEVKVRLAKADGTLTLEVHDNGKGVGRAQLSHSASLGILGMRERALVLGGKLTITGGPGKGTTVRVQIPDVRHEWPE